MCREVDVPELELILFIRTRWASMFACLDRALKLRNVRSYTAWKDLMLILAQAITRFTQLADESEEVPTLRNKKYSSFHLTRDEWNQLKVLHELMKVSSFLCRLLMPLSADHLLLDTGASNSTANVLDVS